MLLRIYINDSRPVITDYLFGMVIFILEKNWSNSVKPYSSTADCFELDDPGDFFFFFLYASSLPQPSLRHGASNFPPSNYHNFNFVRGKGRGRRKKEKKKKRIEKDVREKGRRLRKGARLLRWCSEEVQPQAKKKKK